MRIAFLAAVMASTIATALPAQAQSPRNDREYREDLRDARRDYREDVRDARQDRREDAREDRRDDRRDWRRYRNYSHNRLEPGQNAYYADRYYRDGRYYQPRRLTRNERIYRGQDNRYYCRRSDGTTGLIVGGLAGGLLGNQLAGGGSRTLGTLLGGAAGAAIGNSVDRGRVICR